MIRIHSATLSGVALAIAHFSVAADGNTLPPARPDDKWKLVWQDEFDGKDIDRTRGTHVPRQIRFFTYDANT